jgi:hypothetical protein
MVCIDRDNRLAAPFRRRANCRLDPAEPSDHTQLCPSNGPRFPDPSLAADERVATLSQRFLTASAAEKVMRQARSARMEPCERKELAPTFFKWRAFRANGAIGSEIALPVQGGRIGRFLLFLGGRHGPLQHEHS